MKIEVNQIPHRYRNRFLRDNNGSVSIINNISLSSGGSSATSFVPVRLWGQYFDDTEDIDGDMTVNGKITAEQIDVISGIIKNLLSDEITCDYLTVTKAAHFFKLLIDEIKATLGAVIITPANAKLDKVEAISGGWRCYYMAKDDDGNQIYNCFEVNDQVVCQTFDAATGVSYDVSNQFYWRKVTAVGTTTTTIDGQTRDVHYFDLSASDCESHSMTPKVGDNCVQLGNRTDSTRQAAIIISAYNSQFLDSGIVAPSIVQYAGINDYNLSTHRLNVISNGLNVFKGSYNNNNGQNIETIISNNYSALTLTDLQIQSTVSSHTTSISNLNSSVGSLNSSVSTNATNISSLQQTATSLTSTVSSHTTSISNLNSSVGTIQSDYVTSSTLSQTANSISATITDALGLTGIDITSGKVNLIADTVQVNGNSSQSAWIYLGNQGSYPRGLLGPNRYTAWNSYYDSAIIGAGTKGGFLTLNYGTNYDQIRIEYDGNDNPTISFKRGNYSAKFYINSSGKLIFQPHATSIWPTEGVDNIEALPSGAIYLRSDSCLGVKR